jgi:hypothetical protein
MVALADNNHIASARYIGVLGRYIHSTIYLSAVLVGPKFPVDRIKEVLFNTNSN